MSDAPGRVLIIDDDDDLVASLEDILDSKGYVVETALTAAEGMERAAEFDVQIALIDVRLGKICGIDLIPRLKEVRPKVLCVVMTAHAVLDSAVEAIQKGAYDYLRKPFDAGDLLATLERCLERYVIEEQRTQAVADLKSRNEELQSIFRAAPVGIGMVVNRMITGVNQRLNEMLGYSEEEILGQSARMLYQNQEEFEFVGREKYRQIVEGGTGTVETKWLRKDGRIIDVLLSSTPLDPSDLSAGVTFTALDITERKLAERALRKSEERYSLAQRAAGMGSWDWDIISGGLKWSEHIEPMFGYAPGRFPGTFEAFLERVHPDDRKTVQSSVDAALRGEEDYDILHRIVRPNGELRWMAETADVYRDDEGKPIRMVGIVRDVTEQKLAEEERQALEDQVRHAQKLESLGVLAGGIAHDFNNILMTILGNADLALSELSPAIPARECVLEIEHASRRAAELCQQMLAYSGRGQFVIEALDLSQLVREMAHMLSVSISKNAVLRYEFDTTLPPVKADATQIRQIVMNLITNASEAIGDKPGIISVKTGSMYCSREYLRETHADEELPEGIYAFLEISDTGCGMNKETRSRLFDPFFSTKFTGRGLGLSAVLGIARAHRGAVRVESVVGKGSTIRVLLPIIKDAAVSERRKPARSATRPPKGSGTILMVDDEDTVRRVGRRMLEYSGYSVLPAENGIAALEIFRLRHEEIDCVLLDLTMPEMDGEECFLEMQKIQPDVKVILSSGYSKQEVSARFQDHCLAGFIQKPYKTAELVEIIQNAVRS